MRRSLATLSSSLALAALLVTLPAAAQSWPSLATDLPRAGGGEDDVAVIIGVSDYFKLDDIPGAADNARDWQQYLVRVRGVPPSRTTLLVDDDATRGRIERALKAAAAQARPTGRAIVVFIGHGAPSPASDDGLLLGVDTQKDPDSMMDSGVPQATVSALLAAGKQRETLLIFDACFSGTTPDGSKALVPGSQATIPIRKAPPPQNAVILSASDSFAGPLPGQERPAFSYLLLGALRGWSDVNQDHQVSLDEAFHFTEDTMRAALKQSKRMPQLRGGSGAAVFVASTSLEEAPDVGAILLGRCPDGTAWSGRRCEQSAPAAAPPVAAAPAAPATPLEASLARLKPAIELGVAKVGMDRGTFVVRIPTDNIFRSATLKMGPDVDFALQTLVAEAQAHASVMHIECNTDSMGDDQRNLALSQSRADALRSWFAQHGVDSDRMDALGRGEENPLAQGTGSAVNAQNRRCELTWTE